ELEDEAARLSARKERIALADAAGMHGVHHRDLDAVERQGPALVEAVDLLDPLEPEILGDLEIAGDVRLPLARQRHAVVKVIEVSVGKEQQVERLEILGRVRASGIGIDPSVDKDGSALVRSVEDGGMAEPRNRDAKLLVHSASGMRSSRSGDRPDYRVLFRRPAPALFFAG